MGRLGENPQDTERDTAQPNDGKLARQVMPWLPLVAVPTLLTILVIELLTGFEARSSTLTQRVCTMSWLAVGGYVSYRGRSQSTANMGDVLINVVKVALYAGPAAGSVVVAQMLYEYGVCMRLDYIFKAGSFEDEEKERQLLGICV